MQAAIKDSYDLVLVGAGPAGLSAAARAAEIDREAGPASTVLCAARERRCG